MNKNNDNNNDNDIKVVIVEDEPNEQSALVSLLSKHFPNLTIAGSASTVKDSIILINKTKPDLVFLDMSLPDGNGFEILEQTSYTGYEIIILSSYSDYAVKAFEFSALHYLLKPITLEKLRQGIDKYKDNKTFVNLDDKLRILKESISSDRPNSILLPTGDGLTMYNISEIVHCMADASYTKVFFNNGETIIVSKNLQNFDSILSGSNFVRVHNSHLINLKYVKKYVRGKQAYVILTDGNEIPVAEHRKDNFKEHLNLFAKTL